MKKTFINPESQIPIFQQIVEELERRILSGEIKAGEFLPSIREMALSQSVNPNTVSKSYQQMQSQGMVEAVRGTGLRVLALEARKSEKRIADLLKKKVDECLDVAKALGHSPQDVIELIHERSRK